MTKDVLGVNIISMSVDYADRINERRIKMVDQVLAFLDSIDFDGIMTAVTDFLAKIDLQEVLDKIIAFVAGLVG